MAELIMKSGKNREKTIPLPGTEIVIGQEEDCRIRLKADGISPRHCCLKNSPNGWLIENLDSSNGTFLNGKQIDGELLLQSGDIISLGPVKFQFVEKVSLPEKTTDDEIAGWLMEEDQSKIASPGSAEMRSSTEEAPGDKTFQSIAEEAAEIIRRYQEIADR